MAESNKWMEFFEKLISGQDAAPSGSNEPGKPDPNSPVSKLAPMLANLLAQQQQGGKPDLGGMFSGLLGGNDESQRPKTGTDTIQTLLDVAGVADPTPILDSINAAISLARAARTDNPAERKEHLVNAGISAIAGWIPYLGDTAKIPKFAKGLASSVGEGARSAKFGRSGGSPPTPSGGSGTPPIPPPPPGTPPGSTPPIPPPPPPGTPPGSTPPAPPAGGGYGGGLPFLVGTAAGAGAAYFGGDDDSRRQKYSISRDTMVGEDRINVGKESLEIMGHHGAKLLRGLIDPLQNPFTKLKNLLKAADEIPSALIHWGDALKDSQEHLKAFSGILSAAYQESQVRGLIRNVGSAQRTGGTTADLIKSLDDLKDDLQSYKDAMVNIKNAGVSIAMTITKFGIEIVERITPIDEIKDIINKWAATHGDTKPPAFDFMDNIRRIPGEHTKRPRR